MEAERRQVTVLFADMVGFTSFSERSGEEAAYTLMRSLSKLMDEAVREQGGFVRGFTGDGIMAVFGAPVALEDAPLRACRAALGILQRLESAGPDLEAKHGVRPQLRIGLNTGKAVVGKVEDSADAGTTVLGDTVNLAARLQSLAEPNSVLMSEAMHRLVQGLVDESFAGEHIIRGKSEPQKVYRLDGMRQGASRFEAALSRGLTTFVGRERELEVLERALDDARSQLRVIDVVAEPGLGKSRLLHEFRQRIGKDRAFILSGSCSPDGQQTPFLPFIEVVRGAFRVSAGEAEKDIAQKLEMGLTALGLQSVRNLGLLLHLLGIEAPDDALKGLDGVLIGLRTREILQQLLVARCRLSPVVVVIEDLHWIDSVSEELLSKLINGEVKLRLLALTTRRPEYSPPSLNSTVVTTLPLEPLPTGEIRHLIRERLGVDTLPEGLARQVTEQADGNPLFAEEILSYLTERGILRIVENALEFDASAVASALPASVQSLLAARVDRLAPKDRALLQAASVIGRRFDAELLATVLNEGEVDERLASMRGLDLIHQKSKTGDFEFKHALVRDALYNSLLSDGRTALHLKIAEEIERRSGNRLTEMAEVLAHQYRQTDKADKAFAYLSMAGSKSLGVYSLDEASIHFNAALALLDENPHCASDRQVADFLVPYSDLLILCTQINKVIEVLQRLSSYVSRLGDDPAVVHIRSNHVLALINNFRYQEAEVIQRENSIMAAHLGDSASNGSALYGEIHVSTLVSPKPLHEFENLKKKAMETVLNTVDRWVLSGLWFAIGWEEVHRGRTKEARDAAHELMRIGQQINDPRSTGLGLWVLACIAVTSGSYAEALEYSEQSLAVAITPYDKDVAIGGKGLALVLLRRTEEALPLLEEHRSRCSANGQIEVLRAVESALSLCNVFRGRIAEGINMIDEDILRYEKDGYRAGADFRRLQLAEVYLQIISRKEKPPFLTLLKNLPILLKVMVSAPSRIRVLVTHVIDNPRFDPAGHFVGRALMVLGLLYKIKKKRALALQHLTEARRILSQFGQTPTLAQVETALAELGQQA
jgi:class 3 adenylate cyclase/tetratricopeptide (TPR) repeat protein